MRASIEDASLSVTAEKELLRRFEIHHTSRATDIEKMRASRMEYLESIEKHKVIASEVVVTDPQDLTRVRSEFELICSTTQWHLSEIGLSIIKLSYSNVIMAKLELSTGIWKSTFSLIEQSAAHNKRQLISNAMLFDCLPNESCSPCPLANVKDGLIKVASAWTEAELLRKDVNAALSYCVFENITSNEGCVDLTAKFTCLSTQKACTVKMSVSCAAYPPGSFSRSVDGTAS